MSPVKLDKELEQYRSLMEVPSSFEDGFRWSSLFGALFIAMLMIPGAIYMQLLAGGNSIGPAAQWVTIILFIEVARRAHKNLKRPEIFVLWYMAVAVMMQPSSGLLYAQFLVQSRAATGMGIAAHIPTWVAPQDSEILAQRSFFNPAWYPAIALMIFQTVLGRINISILSYGLFRIASDVEKLPFPMAPVGAQGITALVEQQAEESAQGRASGETSWRWRVFSIGGVLGMSFGALYTALPTISSAVLDQPIVILPIPFVDWTPKTANFLPAVATGISLDVGSLVFGMVLPFYAMLGGFLAWVLTLIANPILYHYRVLTSWSASDNTVMTVFHNYMDFYLSFGLGIAGAVALVGIWQTVASLRKRTSRTKDKQSIRFDEESRKDPPEGRGDFPAVWIGVTYIATSLCYIIVSGYLIDYRKHPGVLIVMLFFAYLYTPLVSYVTARLEGMAGQTVQIPFVREAAFILSGYKGGVDIWFLPVPIADFGSQCVFWRQAELTGTKFWSIWKAQIILVPIMLLSSIFFSSFIWSLAPIPSAQYPYAEAMWELDAAQQSIILSSTMGRHSQFTEAFKPGVIAAGGVVGLGLFVLLRALSLPIMLAYGMVRGLNMAGVPHVIPIQFLGACIGRFYFERKMGLTWRKYVPVVAAGFSCGVGLVTVLSVGVNFLAKSVISITF